MTGADWHCTVIGRRNGGKHYCVSVRRTDIHSGEQTAWPIGRRGWMPLCMQVQGPACSLLIHVPPRLCLFGFCYLGSLAASPVVAAAPAVTAIFDPDIDLADTGTLTTLLHPLSFAYRRYNVRALLWCCWDPRRTRPRPAQRRHPIERVCGVILCPSPPPFVLTYPTILSLSCLSHTNNTHFLVFNMQPVMVFTSRLVSPPYHILHLLDTIEDGMVRGPHPIYLLQSAPT